MCSATMVQTHCVKIAKVDGARDDVIARIENLVICTHLEMRQGARIILKSKEDVPASMNPAEGGPHSRWTAAALSG